MPVENSHFRNLFPILLRWCKLLCHGSFNIHPTLSFQFSRDGFKNCATVIFIASNELFMNVGTIRPPDQPASKNKLKWWQCDYSLMTIEIKITLKRHFYWMVSMEPVHGNVMTWISTWLIYNLSLSSGYCWSPALTPHCAHGEKLRKLSVFLRCGRQVLWCYLNERLDSFPWKLFQVTNQIFWVSSPGYPFFIYWIQFDAPHKIWIISDG